MVKAAILARLRRIELGLKGDAKIVGHGVTELRIHVGAGWRVYYTERHGKIIVLLAGGSKKNSSQRHRKGQSTGINA
ncbi:MAG: type II toxin-antitoxin system RelE/ParE family toxin [Limnobacter sp.]|nr:type II toxin-antitoxin system RelE/ParE family toxin [Limnobacter sp.]MCZ8016488.1 type II toxin-antitoxin system RelE/ParE family toxin [Limnobacter sp.]